MWVESELESELKKLVQEKSLEDYFIFTGYRGDIPRLLSAFEILVMPSLFEGLCFAVIEAQAMGCRLSLVRRRDAPLGSGRGNRYPGAAG